MTSRIGTLQWPLPQWPLPWALWLRAHAQFLVVFACALAIRVTYNLTIARHYVPASAHANTTRNWARSEEHTSELQSHLNLVCRLLLEKKNNNTQHTMDMTRVTHIHVMQKTTIINFNTDNKYEPTINIFTT